MNKNQNGFATLEIILVIGIIAIFSTVAVPKMARILDKVALDYELKHLYSDLNFARSIGKSSTFDGGIFPSGFDNTGNGQIEFWIYSRKLYTTPWIISFTLTRGRMYNYKATIFTFCKNYHNMAAST